VGAGIRLLAAAVAGFASERGTDPGRSGLPSRTLGAGAGLASARGTLSCSERRNSPNSRPPPRAGCAGCAGPCAYACAADGSALGARYGSSRDPSAFCPSAGKPQSPTAPLSTQANDEKRIPSGILPRSRPASRGSILVILRTTRARPPTLFRTLNLSAKSPEGSRFAEEADCSAHPEKPPNRQSFPDRTWPDANPSEPAKAIIPRSFRF
jgi:hypothetical protein